MKTFNKVFMISGIVLGFDSLKACNNLPTTSRRLEAGLNTSKALPSAPSIRCPLKASIQFNLEIFTSL